MKVKAEGDGYAAAYTARHPPEGWCFVQQDGTFLTPGIGLPMYYNCISDLFASIVRHKPKLRLTILCDECGKAIKE